MRGTGCWAGRAGFPQISLLSLQKGGARVRGNREAALAPRRTVLVQSCGPRGGREKAASPNAQPGGQDRSAGWASGAFLGLKGRALYPGAGPEARPERESFQVFSGSKRTSQKMAISQPSLGDKNLLRIRLSLIFHC